MTQKTVQVQYVTVSESVYTWFHGTFITFYEAFLKFPHVDVSKNL